MVAASHTRASTLLEIRSTSTAEMDTVPMVAHMQDVLTASGTNETYWSHKPPVCRRKLSRKTKID